MVKHTQTIRRNLPTNCLSVFDHFVGLALKGLIRTMILKVSIILNHEKLEVTAKSDFFKAKTDCSVSHFLSHN